MAVGGVISQCALTCWYDAHMRLPKETYFAFDGHLMLAVRETKSGLIHATAPLWPGVRIKARSLKQLFQVARLRIRELRRSWAQSAHSIH